MATYGECLALVSELRTEAESAEAVGDHLVADLLRRAADALAFWEDR